MGALPNRIKRHAKRPSRQHLDLLIDQITWLDELGDFTNAISGIPASKLRSLATQAMSLDAANLKKDTLPEKRYSLIVALLMRRMGGSSIGIDVPKHCTGRTARKSNYNEPDNFLRLVPKMEPIRAHERNSASTDLKLVKAFIAILETGSVSAAARRLNITQPSVSHALGRLRELLGDPLFTRTREGMVPTFTATQLYARFKDALEQIEEAISSTRVFEPDQSSRCFRLALSDLGELYFLPRVIEELQRVAPAVELEIVQLDRDKVEEWLSTCRIDAAVGNLGFIGSMTRQRPLFRETYSCLLSQIHPLIGETLSLEQYVAARHVVVAPFSGHHLVEDVMAALGLKRRIALRIPHFTNLSAVIASSDILLTLPTRIARTFAAERGLRTLALPFDIPAFDVNLYWQANAIDTAPQQWFCETLARVLGAL